MLNDEIKSTIQTAYSRLLEQKGYRSRQCQRQMIADIANTLGGVEVDESGIRLTEDNICVVEAGTGTGKTVAYAMAALPIAKALGKRLVISTATVALQEQIVLIDLPDIRQHAELDFSYALAKGRRRYLCLSRLDQALQEVGSVNHTLALYDDEKYPAEQSHQELYESMLARLGQGSWDGDRDSWSSEVENAAWFPVSTDHTQCTQRQCSHFENCYFYKAREQVHKVDCIVTNHDLVLSDLMMGGGAVLPAPEDTIYIFDEGHHLPDKAIGHFSSFLQIRSTQTWLEQILVTMQQIAGDLGDIGGFPNGYRQFEAGISDLDDLLESTVQAIGPLRDLSEGNDSESRYRFPHGVIESELQLLSQNLYQTTSRVKDQVVRLRADVEDRLIAADPNERDSLEYWLPVVSSIEARFESGAGLWQEMMREDHEDEPPTARWVNFRDDDETMLNASPIAVADDLQEMLWSRCFGAVVTSATLAIGGDFTSFQNRSGIKPVNRFRSLASPFNHHQQAVLRVPRMATDPKQADEHTELIATMIPELVSGHLGSLILFSSWRQMFRVTDMLPPEFAEKVLSQGSLSKSEIIAQHKDNVDSEQNSVIFGLASFAEGIDLPGKYCSHVVIAKIPFAVPDDPVGATLSEWIEARGGNSFAEVMIPDATLRIVQACGRLLRTETDSGVITILDTRLVSKRYGSMILRALPPFRMELS